MTTTVSNTEKIGLSSQIVNGILAIKPIANFAKNQARNMMIKRAEKIGVPWRENVRKLQNYDWENKLSEVKNPNLSYPDYYLVSFHAYDSGNLSWEAALEVESAAYAVHAKIWPEANAQGDPRLRQSYSNALKEKIKIQPQNILDMGCSVGMSTFELQRLFPEAKITGLDLSPYFLAVAKYNTEQSQANINWVNNPAEKTGLEDASFDLVSACLMFHELPQKATREILIEAKRLLRPGGYFTIMDMNPASEVFKKMPPYVLTLLKSTEPYLDQYFTFDFVKNLEEIGFNTPTITFNSPRHRTIVAQVKN